DLTVATGALVTDDQVAKVAKLPGVRHVGLNRAGSTRYNGLMVSVDACDIAERLSRPGYSLDQGDVTTARRLAPQGKGVLVSTLFAGRWRVHTGDVLRLQSPSGPLDLPVLGVIAANGQAWLEGVIYLDWSAYRQYWNDPRPEWLSVDLDPGADPVTVKGEVLDALYGAPLAFAATAEELNRNLREQVSSNVNQIFLFYYVQMVIATFVAAIGMINTLVISVWDRRREIGIIRAIGGTRRQLAKIVLVEAALLAIVGLVTGTLKGLFDTYFLSRTASVVFGGYSVPFRFPVVLILLSVPIVIGIALAAAWGPARLAAKMNVVTAIGSE
ncbi:MAG TPA: ABC transporter permease, partial [Blastocatellia bacterium]|nr:ABC transporter permease [Blastocatellia bacterium]